MNQTTGPYSSNGSAFSTLPPTKINGQNHHSRRRPSRTVRSPPPTEFRSFSSLPYDVVARIAAAFGAADVRAASLVCRSWREALRPLREAMVLLRWGKRFKHGRGGVRVNLDKALDSFLKGASRGSAMAMVDAGLIYWETGRKDKAVALYREAAALGDPAAEPPNVKEAVIWLFKSAGAGYVRAQYQLALSLHRGHGLRSNMQEAAIWYLRAAEGGYLRAMYNVALCYSFGEGLVRSHREARKWMKRAAERGHTKAQVEHGLALFSEGEMIKAVVYLELAGRGGETGGAHVKNVILQQLSATSRDRALALADSWRTLPSSRVL